MGIILPNGTPVAFTGSRTAVAGAERSHPPAERIDDKKPTGGNVMRFTILSNFSLILGVLALFGKSIWGVMGNSTWGNSTWDK
jgi:hypothetical protein